MFYGIIYSNKTKGVQNHYWCVKRILELRGKFQSQKKVNSIKVIFGIYENVCVMILLEVLIGNLTFGSLKCMGIYQRKGTNMIGSYY